MHPRLIKGIFKWGAVLLGLWLGLRYLLPVSVPFLLGGGIALMAEPGVGLLQNRLHLSRPLSAAVCVSLTLLLALTVLSLLAAAAVRELTDVAKMAPAVGRTVGQGLTVLEDWLVTLADRAPEELRPVLVQTVLNTFQNGNAFIEQVTGKLPGVVADLIGWLSRGALTVGTGILAGFMISIRLPKIRSFITGKLPKTWVEKLRVTRKGLKNTFGKWIKAQLKLMGITFCVVLAGFLLLQIPYAPVWAVLVALVDAVPVLGTGTVLIPWSVVCFLQGNTAQGAGLLAIFATAWLARSILEPRWVGKSLGIDPLLSLLAFYVGFRLLGVVGMVLAPMVTAFIKSVLDSSRENNSQIIHKETS